MWDRVGKRSISIESKVQSTSPSIQLQAQNESDIRDEVLSPESMQPSIEPPPLSPLIDDDEEDDDGDDEAVYDIDLLSHDPGKRIPITQYDVNEQDAVRRGYIALGPCQPREHDFPRRNIGGMRRFVATWYDAYNWLEYSVERDAAFCFVCYLFKEKTNYAGGDSFVNGGFRNWNHKNRFEKHIGGIKSAHNEAQEKYDLFITPRASIQESFASNTKQDKILYKTWLTCSLKCLRFLLRQGLACRGHDESEESHNKGNFLELLNWLAENFEEVNKVVLKSAPRNNRMTAPTIQK